MPKSGKVSSGNDLEAIRSCQFCMEDGKNIEALFYAKLRTGKWALLCANHFRLNAIGLGDGLGCVLK